MDPRSLALPGCLPLALWLNFCLYFRCNSSLTSKCRTSHIFFKFLSDGKTRGCILASTNGHRTFLSLSKCRVASWACRWCLREKIISTPCEIQSPKAAVPCFVLFLHAVTLLTISLQENSAHWESITGLWVENSARVETENCKQNVKSREVAGKLLRNAQLDAPGLLLLLLLLFFSTDTCWLSYVCCHVGGAAMFWAWSGGRTFTQKAMICLHWVSNYVPAVECSSRVWKGAQIRGQSASCASGRAVGRACSLSPNVSASKDCEPMVAQTPVRRNLFSTHWDRARLWDGRISNRRHLKITFGNGIQSAPE